MEFYRGRGAVGRVKQNLVAIKGKLGRLQRLENNETPPRFEGEASVIQQEITQLKDENSRIRGRRERPGAKRRVKK